MRVGYTDGMKAESFPMAHSLDTVVCLNVIEHLQDDVLALRNILNILGEHGRAIILVPNGPGLYGSLDEVLGHCRRYTSDSLTELAQKAGFRVERILKFNRPGVIAWWLNGRILRAEDLRSATSTDVEPADAAVPHSRLVASSAAIIFDCHIAQGRNEPCVTYFGRAYMRGKHNIVMYLASTSCTCNRCAGGHSPIFHPAKILKTREVVGFVVSAQPPTYQSLG
jgi:SAM-dependent methyltransferase